MSPDPNIYASLLQRLHALRQAWPAEAEKIDQEIDLVVKLATHPVRRPESVNRWMWTLAT